MKRFSEKDLSAHTSHDGSKQRAQSIKYEISVAAGQWYSAATLKNIKYGDGTAVIVNDSIEVKFLAPVIGTEFRLSNPYVTTAATFTKDNSPEHPEKVVVMCKNKFLAPYTFSSATEMTIAIGGNFNDGDWANLYSKSFTILVDKVPAGQVKVNSVAPEDQALVGHRQSILLTSTSSADRYEFTYEPGKDSDTFRVEPGTYTLTAGEIANADETRVGKPQFDDSQIEVVESGVTDILAGAYKIDSYGALDVQILQLSAPLDTANFSLEVTLPAGPPKMSLVGSNSTTPYRRLANKGNVTIKPRNTVDNRQRIFEDTIQLRDQLTTVAVADGDFSNVEVPTNELHTLKFKLNGSQIVNKNVSISFRNDTTAYSAQPVALTDDTAVELPLKVLSEEYTLVLTGLSMTAEPIGWMDRLKSLLEVTMRAFDPPGTKAAGEDGKGLKDLVNARVSVIFKYSGNDGAGDPGEYRVADPATKDTVALAKRVTQKLESEYGGEGDEHYCLPMMVAYTCDLSLGEYEKQLHNQEGLARSFANYILSLLTAVRDGVEGKPAAFVVNADFIGEFMKGWEGANGSVLPTYGMPAWHALEVAVKKWEEEWETYYHWATRPNLPSVKDIPASIGNTGAGYIAAVNWITWTYAPDISFGWQINLWSVGTATWIHGSGDEPKENAKKIADYVKTLNVYDREFAPDFVAVNRFERDDFNPEAYGVGYCYGPREWRRYYDFARELAYAMEKPVMAWQIPAGRVPVKGNDSVSSGGDALIKERWGTGSSYLFDDLDIGPGSGKIHETVLELQPGNISGVSTVRELLKKSEPYDFGKSEYHDLASRGIFTVQLGGGLTTGVITNVGKTGDWTQKKTATYREKPISLKNGEVTWKSHIYAKKRKQAAKNDL